MLSDHARSFLHRICARYASVSRTLLSMAKQELIEQRQIIPMLCGWARRLHRAER